MEVLFIIHIGIHLVLLITTGIITTVIYCNYEEDDSRHLGSTAVSVKPSQSRLPHIKDQRTYTSQSFHYAGFHERLSPIQTASQDNLDIVQGKITSSFDTKISIVQIVNCQLCQIPILSQFIRQQNVIQPLYVLLPILIDYILLIHTVIHFLQNLLMNLPQVKNLFWPKSSSGMTFLARPWKRGMAVQNIILRRFE